MALRNGALIGAVALAVLGGACLGDAAAANYDVAIVSIDRGTEDFFTGMGRLSGQVSTSNLPLLTSTSADYSLGIGVVSSNWTLSDGGSNAIVGIYQTPGRGFANGLAPSGGTITINQGSGLFAGATGSGTFEAFTRESYDPILNLPFYEQLTVTRLKFSAANGPAQTDRRPVAVSARVGIDDFNTNRGVNVGVPTSDSNPIVITSTRSEYDLSMLPQHGESFAKNALGDTQHWTYITDATSGPYDDVLYRSFGTATIADGTGAFANDVGTSDWEAFGVGLGLIANNVFAYSVVSIDRYTIGAVPEPQTYVLMAAGIGFVAFTATRRRKRS